MTSLKSKWWEYFISILLIVIGAILIYCGKVYRLKLSKRDMIISKSKTNVICRSVKKIHSLKDISSIQIVKKGKETATSNTVRYRVVAILNNSKNMMIKETRSLQQAKIYVLKIDSLFIGIGWNLDFKCSQ